jgi:hypothetical protein
MINLHDRGAFAARLLQLTGAVLVSISKRAPILSG